MAGTTFKTTFESKRPGSWERDFAHMPHPVTAMFAALLPESFETGFAETFERHGLPLHTIGMEVINGFVYMYPTPLHVAHADDPGFDLMAALTERTEIAQRAFEQCIWRDQVREWDETVKQAAMAAHAALAGVDLPALSDLALAEHIGACMEHHRAMVRQHHRFNGAVMLPVGDFVAHATTWTGKDPSEIMTVFEGYSPLSGVWSDEIAEAASAVAASADAMALIDGSGDAAKRLFELRQRVPAVDAYLNQVTYRVIDGFDITAPTIGEMPALALGKLGAAARLGGPPSTARADARAAELRQLVPEQHQAEFDRLLSEARLVYRVRDERGVCSDMSSAGILRLALLELGRRLAGEGLIGSADHALYLEPDEAIAAASSRTTPAAEELATRAQAVASPSEDPPERIGPPPEPIPLKALPPPLARAVTAIRLLNAAPPAQDSPGPGVLKGVVGHPGHYVGTARVVRSPADLLDVEPGDVLVAATTSEAFNAAIFLAGAIVTDHGGLTSHAAIVAREVGIPAVVGTTAATTTITSGDRVEVDGTEGIVTVVS